MLYIADKTVTMIKNLWEWMTMNILIQDFCNYISEGPQQEIKSKTENSFCLTKPDAKSSGGEEDWLPSGQLVDGNIKYDLHSFYDVCTEERRQIQDRSNNWRAGYKEQRCKVLFAHINRIASNWKNIWNVKSACNLTADRKSKICELVRNCIYWEFFWRNVQFLIFCNSV